MWDYDPPPLVQISVYVIMILFPYMDDVLVLFLDLYGGRIEGMCVPHGMETLFVYLLHISERAGGSTMFVSVEFLTLCGMYYVHIIMTLEGQLMEFWICEHSAYEESWILDGVTNGKGEVL